MGRTPYWISESTQSSIFNLGKVGHESLLQACCTSISKKGKKKKRTLSSSPGKKCCRKWKSYNCCCLSKTSWKRNGRQSPKETWDELWDPLLIFFFLCSLRELLLSGSAEYRGMCREHSRICDKLLQSSVRFHYYGQDLVLEIVCNIVGLHCKKKNEPFQLSVSVIITLSSITVICWGQSIFP